MLVIHNATQFKLNGKNEYGIVKLKIYRPKLNLINFRLNFESKNFKWVRGLLIEIKAIW